MRIASPSTLLPVLLAGIVLPTLSGPSAAQNGWREPRARDSRDLTDESQWYDPTDWFDNSRLRGEQQSDDTGPYGEGSGPGYDGYWYDDANGYNDYYEDWWGGNDASPDYDDYGYEVYPPATTDEWDWSDQNPDNRNHAYGNRQFYSVGPYSQSYGQNGQGHASASQASARSWRWSPQQGRWVPAQQTSSGGRQQDQQQSQQRSRQQHQQSRQQQTTLSGTLDGYRRVNLRGAKDRHTLIRLRMQDGTQRIVNLGPRVDAGDLNLTSGNHVRVQGRLGHISGQPVLMAETIDIQPSGGRMQQGGQPSQQSQGYASRQSGGQQGQTTLQGRVMDWNRDDLGSPSGRTLVYLQTQNGGSQTVAFPPDVNLSDYGLQRGDSVAVRGSMTQGDDGQVLQAQQLRIDQGQDGRTGSSSGSSSGRFATLSGTLQDWSRKNLHDEGDHTFVKLQLQDGSSRLVDLGPRVTVPDSGLQRGDRISVRGPMTQVEDRPVLAARQFRIDGQRIGIDTSSAQPAKPGR